MGDSLQFKLPSDIKNYLLSSEINERNKQIIDKYKFGNEEQKKYFKIILKIFLKELSFSSLPAVLMSDLKIDDDKAIKQLMQDIKEIVLSPVKEYLGLDSGRKVGYEVNILIEKAVKKFNLFAGDDAAAKGKFSEMAETFLSNVRTKTQFKNTLMKPVSDGGLGMEKTMADDVAEFLASYSRLEPVIAKSEATKQSRSAVIARSPQRSNLVSNSEIATPSEGLAMTQNAKLVPPNVKIEVSFEKEEKEAAAKKPKIEKMRIAAPKLLSVTEGVQSALAELNYNFPSSELQDRLKSIIDARVRNVRTSIQTFDKLTQDVPSGGLGFSKLEADKVSLVLNKYLEDKNKDIYGSKLAEIKQAEDEEKRKNEERARVAEDAEKKNFDERFTKLTGKTPSPMPVVAPIQAPALTKKEIAEKKQEKSVPPPPVIPDSERQRGNYSGIQKNNLDSRLRGNDTKTTPAMTPKERPVLEDIKFTPKLAGPLEEISQLTMDDFRKLSHDPKEAVLKIKDKLGLLRGESYKKYHLGIDAWRKSPLFGDYLKIINKSLGEGVSLDDAISAAKTLTKDEFDAIINSRVDE